MPVIVCVYDMFKLKHPVTIIDTQGPREKDILVGEYELNNLGTAIATTGDKHNINEVHIFGIPDFVDTIAEEVINYSIAKYNKNNFSIYINE